MNDFKKWHKKHGASAMNKLASSIGTNKYYLYQLTGGFRKPSVSLAIKIEESTKKITPMDFVSKEG